MSKQVPGYDQLSEFAKPLNPATGVYNWISGIQGATPKYAKNDGNYITDFKETLARLFIKTTAQEVRLAKVPASLAQAAKRLYGNGYVDFILQNIMSSQNEKLHLTDNLADGYVAYYLGQAPIQLQCSGALINSLQDDQVVSMVRLYTEFMRGTKLAEHGETVRLRYDSYLYTGMINNIQWSLSAENELFCPFSFSFLVKSRTFLPSKYFNPVSLEAVDYAGTDDAVGRKLTAATISGDVTVTPSPPSASSGAPPTPNQATVQAQNTVEQLSTNAAPREKVDFGFFSIF